MTRTGIINGIGTIHIIIGITPGEEALDTLTSMVITVITDIRVITVTGILGTIPAITDFTITTVTMDITGIMAITHIIMACTITCTTGTTTIGEDQDGIMAIITATYLTHTSMEEEGLMKETPVTELRHPEVIHAGQMLTLAR